MLVIKKIFESPIVIIVLSSVLVLIHIWPVIFLVKFGLIKENDPLFSLIAGISSFIFFFLIPFFVIKYIYKKNISFFGVRWPINLKDSIELIILSLVYFIPLMYFFSKESIFQDFYSINRGSIYFISTTLGAVIYYFSEEFLFRGFLFFGLWNKFKFHTFWIINLLFCFFHIGKPFQEIIFSFFMGLILTFLSYKTKSIIPATLVHFILAMVLNILVTYFVVSEKIPTGLPHF